ncbi:transmembrane protein 192 isoform X2 [Ammospiza caudacuta]|uniref:transmembrane protein 192 isoform X2 n=1 Tax=Ammospiza caudacuta TaxID=2857398 RepID=UPI00273882AB|nr:transmembrane protein 192 isoform X2 [Ammospiza caudacuta]
MALTAGRRRQDLDNGSLEITQSLEDDPLLDAPLISSHTLHSQLRPRFHAIPAVLLGNFLLLIHVAFVVLAFLAAMFCSYPNPNQDKCPGNYTHPLKVQTVIIIAKVVLWVLHVCFERFVQHHHSRVRRRGYFSIYRSTRHLKRLPLLIHATVKISNFNRAKPRPDIIEEEKMYAYPSQITSEVGFRENSSLEEIVEKQGDVIEYLQRHNALLSKRLLALTSQQIKT